MTMFSVSGGGETGRTMRRRGKRQQAARIVRYAEELATRWASACEGAGLGADGKTASGSSYTTLPRVTHVNVDPPVTMMVKLSGGQVVGDFQREHARIAENLGVRRVAFHRRSSRWMRVTLDPPDPFAADVARPEPVAMAAHPVVFGRQDSGHMIRRSLLDCTHIAVQGMTGSGKSVFGYNLLAQLAPARDVDVCGVDPSGLLLQPFAHSGRVSVGSASVLAHVATLEGLVTEMDDRITDMPTGVDQVAITEQCPLRLVVIEEMPGLLRAAERHDASLTGNARGQRLVPRLKAAYGRLMAEGRKAGFRLLLIAQRMDAEIVGGFERGQISDRITFAVDSPDAVKMLHPSSATAMVDDHQVAPAGVALVTTPGVPVTRMRAPADYPYADYCHDVANSVVTTR